MTGTNFWAANAATRLVHTVVDIDTRLNSTNTTNPTTTTTTDSLQARRSGIQTLVRAKFSAPVQTGP
jgi:hypothetical protein